MQTIILGNFDGVHLGHQALLGAAQNSTRVAGGVHSARSEVRVITFDPPPRAILDPHCKIERLQSLDDRIKQLKFSGATTVEILRPTFELLGRSAVEFITDLHARLRFDRIVEGGDFRFGRGREGTMELLRALGLKLGFEVVEVPAVQIALRDGSIVEARSGRIRDFLRDGNVADAARLLGRGFTLRGTVSRGDQRGRTMGWPTVNLDAHELASHQLLLPADGVYAGFARTAQRVGEWNAETPAIAAISIGSKPTFAGVGTTVEATLLGADSRPLRLDADAYGWTVEIEFRECIRSQVRFESLEALLAQMELDRARIVESVRGVTP